MAERSFASEVQDLKLGEGEVFRGEGILAITKALAAIRRVSYVGWLSGLADLASDGRSRGRQGRDERPWRPFRNLGLRRGRGRAMLSASVMYPVRGAVTWKSTAGTNVASDALSNLSSGGVTGGALIVIGEDYGEGSSIMQERSACLCDEVADLACSIRVPICRRCVSRPWNTGLNCRKASNYARDARGAHPLPVTSTGNSSPRTTRSPRSRSDRRSKIRRATSTASYCRRLIVTCTRRKSSRSAGRPPIAFIKQRRKLNETFFGPGRGRGWPDRDAWRPVSIIGACARCSNFWASPTSMARSAVPLYVMNVAYPMIDDEDGRILPRQGRRADGRGGRRPEYIEQALNTLLRRRDIQTRVRARIVCRWAASTPRLSSSRRRGEKFSSPACARALLLRNQPPLPDPAPILAHAKVKALAGSGAAAPAGFCIGCPERPIFAAMKLVEQELGPHHISADIGCHLFSILPPFNIGATTMGYGLGTGLGLRLQCARSRQARRFLGDGRRRFLAQRPRHRRSATRYSTSRTASFSLSIISTRPPLAARTFLSSRALNPRRKTNNSIVAGGQGASVCDLGQADRSDLRRRRDA